MPELPEVETVRAYLDEALAGRKIEHVEVLLPRLIKNADPSRFCRTLEGQVIQSVCRRGKYLVLTWGGPEALLVHLRMTGALVYQDEPADIKGRRVIFTLDRGRLVYRDIRNLGCLWIVPDGGMTGVNGFDSLGPDGNSPACTADYLMEKMKGSRRNVKSFLLDQTCVAGLGNIYVDEALFAAAIAPQRRCDAVGRDEAETLRRAIGDVLAQGLARGGTTIRNFVGGSGREGENQAYLRVYGREGTPCPRCGSRIVYVKLGGRGTRYCPGCQT